MRDTVICKNITPAGNVCGNIVTINTEEDSAAVSSGAGYVIKCSKCNNEIRTISSRSMPIVKGGYAERDPY
ncbi:MAG: hypothetical protein K2K34_08075 [Oscillospiraceae bacterium]|nr:hypothetical protein [Oscillospiraceae bacterium]